MKSCELYAALGPETPNKFWVELQSDIDIFDHGSCFDIFDHCSCFFTFPTLHNTFIQVVNAKSSSLRPSWNFDSVPAGKLPVPFLKKSAFSYTASRFHQTQRVRLIFLQTKVNDNQPLPDLVEELSKGEISGSTVRRGLITHPPPFSHKTIASKEY